MILKYCLSFVLLLSIGNREKEEELPPGWFSTGSNPENYTIGIDRNIYKNGAQSAYIESAVPNAEGFTTLMQVFPANHFLGKKVRLTGFLKTENVSDCAALWLRIDGKAINQEKIEVVKFKNTCDTPMTGTNNWKKIEITLYVPFRSQLINLGALLAGNGKIWFDEFQIEVDSDQINNTIEPEMTIKPRNLDFEE